MNPSITIAVPIPPRCLSPNGRAHWRAKGPVKRAARIDTQILAREQMGRGTYKWERATVAIRWYSARQRWPDRDNMVGSLKSHLDGLADAGLIVDDNGLTILPPERLYDKDSPRVELTITQEPKP